MVVTSSNTRIGSALNSMTASPSATPLSNTKPVSPSLFKSIFLHEWWLVKPQWQCNGLAVGGVASINKQACNCNYYRSERVFLSSVIAKRHEANVLETEDGITIIFRGFINASRTCENGFPSQVCHHFLFGFPHDWKKYTVHSFGDEYINGVTGFGDLNACSQKRADDPLPFSIHDNDSAPKEICNGLGNSLWNVSQQSESTHNMECNIAMKTMECECKDDTTSLKSSKPQVDMMHNGENGISDVVVESQAGNPESGQSLMGMYDPNSYTVLSGESMVESPISSKKMRKGQLSSDCKEKQLIRQKIMVDAVNTCSTMVTRSTSKRSHAMLKEDEKVTVRRSPRLYNRRK